MTAVADRYEFAARMFEPRSRRYADPGSLACSLDPKAKRSPALNRIDEALTALMAPGADHDGLAVFMPPQEGKSQKCSRRFPEWLLDHDPTLHVAIVSYEEDTAIRWGREIKMDVALNPCRSKTPDCRRDCGGLHITIRKDSSAAGRWQTPAGGGLYCVGVGGPLTGQHVDVLIIDDPVKDRAAAESERIRETTWDWWESVAIPRLATPAKVVLIQTRWHEDDLAGRIFSRPGPLRWKRLDLPAIANAEPDPIGRQLGEELPSVRNRPPGYFANLRATLSAYVFNGIFQQTPTAPEGNFFRRQTFRYWRPADPWNDGRERISLDELPVTLADTWRFVTMDFAASSKTSADYTVASAWAVTGSGDLILLDRVRGRVPDHQHFKLALPLIRRWKAAQVYVESNWWSSTFVTDARDNGIPVAEVRADTDKVQRAIPAAGRVHSGKVWFPAETSGCACGNCDHGKWLDEWCDELAAFPRAKNDDQVDTLSYAARIVVNDWTPPRASPRTPQAESWEQAIDAAYGSATGDGHGALDAFSVPY